VVVLALSPRLMRQPELLQAALDRLTEFAQSGAAVYVVCPTPIVLAALLARRGVPSGATIIEGDQAHAIEFARRVGSARVVLYTDSELTASSASHVEMLELADRHAVPVSRDAAFAASVHEVAYEARRVTDDSAMLVRSDGFEDRSSPVTSIVLSSGYALVSLRAKPHRTPPWETAKMQLLERIAAAGISIEMLQWFGLGVRFLVQANRVPALRAICEEFGLASQIAEDCARICIIGMGVRSTAGVFYTSLNALMERGITLLHCADSNVTLSFVVNVRHARDAEKALRAALALGHGDAAQGPPLTLDADLGLVRLNGRDIHLGRRQAQLLHYFLANVGRVVEAEELARALFGAENRERVAAIRVHLHNLRKKIEHDPESPRYIVTVPDQGYVFVR
jgi:hypothetical protein